MNYIQMILMQALLSIVIAVLIIIFLNGEIALSFSYGGLMVIVGQLSIWWVGKRTQIIKDRLSEHNRNFSNQDELSRMLWAQLIKFIAMTLMFIFAWKSERLLLQPFSIVAGYLTTTLLVIPLHHCGDMILPRLKK